MARGKLWSQDRVRWSQEKIIAELRELDSQGVEMSLSGIGGDHSCLYNACRRHFGSFDNACWAAGLTRVRERRQWSKDGILGDIKLLHQAGQDLSAGAMTRDHRALYISALNFFQSWDDALISAGLDPSEIRKYRVYDGDVVADLLKQRLDAELSIRPLKLSQDDPPLYQNVRRYFGTVDNAERYLEERSKRGKKSNLGVPARKSPAGNPRWTEEAVLSELRSLGEGGAELTTKEVREASERLYRACLRHFGSVGAAVEALSD